MKLYMTKKQSDKLKTLQEKTHRLMELTDTPEQEHELRLLDARISGALLSPLLPPGGLRVSLMLGLVAGGVLGCVYWSWWFAFAWLAAAVFSPRIVGEVALLAGRFARGYRGDD